MSATYIKFNPESPRGRSITRALQLLREGRDLLEQERSILIQMIDGTTDDATHYGLPVTEIGYQAAGYESEGAAAMASFAELDSLRAQLANCDTALAQCCAKHGV
jgi:hypothetical protein